MNAWNETHYARAQEYTRLLSRALSVAAPATAANPATALASVVSPVIASPPPPSPAASFAPVPPAAPAPAGAQPAANLFKQIPWKK